MPDGCGESSQGHTGSGVCKSGYRERECPGREAYTPVGYARSVCGISSGNQCLGRQVLASRSEASLAQSGHAGKYRSCGGHWATGAIADGSPSSQWRPKGRRAVSLHRITVVDRFPGSTKQNVPRNGRPQWSAESKGNYQMNNSVPQKIARLSRRRGDLQLSSLMEPGNNCAWATDCFPKTHRATSTQRGHFNFG